MAMAIGRVGQGRGLGEGYTLESMDGSPAIRGDILDSFYRGQPATAIAFIRRNDARIPSALSALGASEERSQVERNLATPRIERRIFRT